MPVFTANIPGILKVGDRITIGGKIKENARKMSVNLCAQEGEEPRDVVLHFDVRFHRDNIISLSRKNGVWIGSGNYDTNYNMFVPGTIFRIVFEIKHTDVITIYCQGKFHSNFLPKIPLTMAKYIVAWADIERVTHCYFYLDNKVGDESFFPQMPIQQNQSAGDAKRRHPCRGYFKPEPNLIYHQHHTVPGKRSSKISPNSQKKSYMPGSPQAVNSTDESSERELRGRTKGNRPDRHFYETLMYPQANRMRADPPRNRADCKKYNRCVSDTDGKYTEDVSKTETDSR